jgi:hypothetical protein
MRSFPNLKTNVGMTGSHNRTVHPALYPVIFFIAAIT